MNKKTVNQSSKNFVVATILMVALVILAGVIYAYVSSTKSDKYFETVKVKEATIYLPKGQKFEPYQDKMNDFAAIGNDMMINVLVDRKSFFTENDTDIPNLFSYAATIASKNGAEVSSIEYHDNYYTFEINSENKDGYHYFAGVYETENNFYLVSFVTFQSDAKLLKAKINRYLEMVEFIDNDQKKEDEAIMNDMYLLVGNTKIEVEWLDNDSVKALYDNCKEKDIVVEMSMYAGNEQFGSLGQDYPVNDQHTTTSLGDIVLYNGNQIVLFYGSNSWAYTRLGKMKLANDDVIGLLSNGDIVLTITRRW